MGISLITMSQGNVLALRKTFESFSGIVDEIVYGDVLLFPEDREVVHSYKSDFNLKIIPFPFNYIFENGFSEILNALIRKASNNIFIYMNCSEVIDEKYDDFSIVDKTTRYNSFYFIHRTDPHRWFRCADRRDLKWSGIIHEQVDGYFRPYHRPIFMMKDLDKDMDNKFKASVFDRAKELTYFNQYVRLVDNPDLLGETNEGWLRFAKGGYEDFKERMASNGRLHDAFKCGDAFMLAEAIGEMKDTYQKFKSSVAIEYQNDKKFLL